MQSCSNVPGPGGNESKFRVGFNGCLHFVRILYVYVMKSEDGNTTSELRAILNMALQERIKMFTFRDRRSAD